MQVDKINSNNTFQGFYNNKLMLKTLEVAADNGALFTAGTAVALSAFIRPLAILSTPKAKKENKKYACTKSIASSIVGLGVMYGISKPIVDSVKNITDNPQKFLMQSTINTLKETNKSLENSSKFIFSTQLFKLSSTVLSVIPKAFLTCALIPPIFTVLFREKHNKKTDNNTLTFCGGLQKSLYTTFTDKISKGMGKVLNNKYIQHFADKFKDTNFAQHMFNCSDILATGLFAKYTLNNKNIKEANKKSLIANASIMTAISVLGGYYINSLLKKPTDIFINKLKSANPNSPKLQKYITGVKIAKPALILGGIYYILAPMVATALSDVITNRNTLNE